MGKQHNKIPNLILAVITPHTFFPRSLWGGEMKDSGNKVGSPRDHTLSALLYIKTFPLNNHIAITKKQRRQNVFIHNRQSC